MSGAIGTWRPGWGRLNTEAMGPAVVALLVPITYIAGALVTPLIHPAFAMYLLQPLGWLIPAALVVRLLGDRRGELLAGGALLPVAVGIAALQTGLATLAGFLFGFGDSPYAHPLAALSGTLWFVCATVAGREVVRWYLARALRPCGERAALLVTAVLLWPAALAPAGVATLTDASAAIPYLAREILPAAAASLFATALALRGGAIAAIAYAGFLLVFEWTAPVLPDLPWPVAATIGTMVPLIGAWWLFGRQHGQEGNQRQRIVGSRRRMAPAVPLVAASALALAVLVPVTNASWTDRQLVGGRVSIGNFCPIAADVKITPRVLDGDQENGTVTVHISFPGGLPPVFGEDRIETDSISLRAIGGGSVRPTDGGRNSLKFDKGAVIDIIGGTPTENTEVTFELRGQAGGCAFSGADTVTYRPAKKTPSPNTAPKSAPVDVPAVADPSPTAVPSTVPTPDAPDAPGETPTPIPTTTPGPTATPRRTAEPTSTTAPLTATPEPPIPTPLPPTPTPKPTATAVPSVAPAGSPSSRP